METRARREKGIRSRKISISVSHDDLVVLRARAKRLHRNNLSAVVHEMVAALQREEAADHVLAMLGGERVGDADIQAVRDETRAPRSTARKRRTAA